jgi:formylglycine-generating enzyme required for sulfatase activity
MKSLTFLTLLIFLSVVALSQSRSKQVKLKPAPVDLSRFVWVSGGSFMMGSATGIEPHEKPEHQVTVGGFYIGRYEVTLEDYDRYCDSMKLPRVGDDGWGRGKRPAIYVSWIDAISYCNWLSKRDHLQPCYIINGTDVKWIDTARGYRLPTEAEWEYAARGGDKSKHTFYAGAEKPDEVIWYKENTNKTQPTGQKVPNELGLYDMNGNVWEWVWDWYDGGYYQHSPTDNPTGPESGNYRVMRGGAWYNNVNYVTVSSRQNSGPGFKQNSVGFRIVRNK